MHASVEQLLNLRDQQLVDAKVSQHVSECSQCQHELEAYQRIRVDLNNLPLSEPSSHLFANILERAGSTPAKRRFEWAKLGLAASLVAALSIMLMQNMHQDSTTDEIISVSPTAPATDQLKAQSAELEKALRRVSFGNNRGVVNVRTADTIVALEDKLKFVDYRLSHGGLTPVQAQHLWRERVRLMDSLLRVHYASIRGNSY